jgi:glycosyltransferase involved in cell wall biosynthesis
MSTSNNYRCSLFCSFYNGGDFIREYLHNFIDQPLFHDIELVFLDCASTDNESDIINIYKTFYKNIQDYRLDTDPGLYAAWNIAIDKCSSNIIGNWNIDDRKNRDGLEILLKTLENDSDIDLVYGLTYISHVANERYTDNKFTEIYPCLPHSLDNLFKNNSPHCMPLWRKNLHDKFGYFNEQYKTASDGDFWLRCARHGAKIKMINHPVGLYYMNPNGRSTNPETLKEMVDEVKYMRQLHLEEMLK